MSVSYERALEALAGRLSPQAVEHCESTADMAGLLATLYGADVELARVAGLLHDWDREQDRDELIGDAGFLGIEVSEVDRRYPYLLHARTAAKRVAESFGDLPGVVISAVEKHTTGAVEMSELDKIVYIADMVESGRTYPGVDDLREAVGTVSLDQLFAHCYAATVSHLVECRKPIHPVTVDVWNAHVAQVQR